MLRAPRFREKRGGAAGPGLIQGRDGIMRRAWYQALMGLERYRAETDRRSNLPLDVQDFAAETV